MNAMDKNLSNQTSKGSNADWHARRLAATPRGVAVMGDFFIDHAKNAEGGRDRIATALDRQADDVLRIEVCGVFRE